MKAYLKILFLLLCLLSLARFLPINYFGEAVNEMFFFYGPTIQYLFTFCTLVFIVLALILRKRSFFLLFALPVFYFAFYPRQAVLLDFHLLTLLNEDNAGEGPFSNPIFGANALVVQNSESGQIRYRIPSGPFKSIDLYRLEGHGIGTINRMEAGSEKHWVFGEDWIAIENID